SLNPTARTKSILGLTENVPEPAKGKAKEKTKDDNGKPSAPAQQLRTRVPLTGTLQAFKPQDQSDRVPSVLPDEALGEYDKYIQGEPISSVLSDEYLMK